MCSFNNIKITAQPVPNNSYAFRKVLAGIIGIISEFIAIMDQFCGKCEALLMSGPICSCGFKNVTAHTAITSRVWFNKRKDLMKPDKINTSPETDGPRVEKYCNRCGTLTDQTYFTAQLRSADEGQTVFYRCTRCLIQTSENS